MNARILARNNVVVSGRDADAPTILFAHGFGCDQNMWRYLVPAFEPDYRVVRFDYVGCGRSDWSAYRADRYDSLHGYVRDVLDVCRALELRQTVFVGHSVSAMVGLLASIECPEYFSRLILIGPSPRYINESPDYIGGFEQQDLEGLLDLMDKNYIGWASFLAPVVMGNSERPELSQELEQSFCSTDPEISRRFAKVTFLSDNRSDLTRVTVPSLILQCSDDVIAPVAVGEYLKRMLPRSSFRQMEATGHCPHLSHPDETIRLIRDHLSSAS